MGAFIMKKVVFILVIAFLTVGIGTISAQGWGPRNAPESVKIDGTLQLHNGQFAVASGNSIYYVPRIARYVGFIENLKEGTNVSFEGYVSGNFLQPLKMTVSGKTYDLAGGGDFGGMRNRDFNNRNDRNFDRFGPGFGPGPGSCCYGQGFGGSGSRNNFRGRR
jgi:hypothetical protein